ncbi:MAG: alpha/beta fold hydrolase [Gemmatimonadaceae bacterium]|nr:alpha/beta fold hydrolase [Gemmatimonadaceae bacterium]
MHPTVCRAVPALLASVVLCGTVFAQSPLPRRGALGTALTALTDSSRAALALPATESGAVVTTLTPGGTAATMGVRLGDVVLAVNGAPTRTPGEVVQALAPLRAGAPIELRTWSAKERVTRRGTLAPRPLERTERWETIAEEVGAPGSRQRVLITRPLTAGRHPVLFVIGGIGAYTMDGPLAAVPYGPIFRAFADAGWATVRVDKPGQGDSEGGPIGTLRFEQELAGYRAALTHLAKQPWADTTRVVLFGHSMGGSFAPILASELPMVRGVAVEATIGVTFAEYWLINLRRQLELGGTPAPQVDALLRDAARIMPLVMEEGQSPAAVAKAQPRLAASVAELFPDGQTLSGMGIDFFRELNARNIAEHWSRVSAKVLVMAGEADFVATRADHPRIAAIVNAAHPGRATYRLLERTDHSLNVQESEATAFANMGKPAPFNPLILEVLGAWAKEWAPG